MAEGAVRGSDDQEKGRYPQLYSLESEVPLGPVTATPEVSRPPRPGRAYAATPTHVAHSTRTMSDVLEPERDGAGFNANDRILKEAADRLSRQGGQNID